jgi:hypothetical protein
MNTHANTLERPLPRTAAQAAARIAVATTAISAPIATYVTFADGPHGVAVALWLGFAVSLWAAVRLDPEGNPRERIVTLLAGGLLANGAGVLAAIGTFVAVFASDLCGSRSEGAWIGGLAVAGLLYVALAPCALAGGLRPLWAWPLLVLASVATGLLVVELAPGVHGMCGLD